MSRPHSQLKNNAEDVKLIEHECISVNVDADDVMPRVNGNLREVQLSHMIAMASNIAMVGILQPIVVDNKCRLIAGAHRLYACRLLAISPKERMDWIHEMIGSKEIVGEISSVNESEIEGLTAITSKIPANKCNFDSSQRRALARHFEVIENEKRQNYTPEEVSKRYDELKSLGLRSRDGRPKNGELSVLNAIECEFGISKSTIYRMVKSFQAGTGKPSNDNDDLARYRKFYSHLNSAYLEACAIEDDAMESISFSILPLLSDVDVRIKKMSVKHMATQNSAISPRRESVVEEVTTLKPATSRRLKSP